MLKQSLQQKLLQKLSPQQIQLMKLLQLPTIALEQRIKEELEANPALEEGREEVASENDEYDDYEEGQLSEAEQEFDISEYMDDNDTPDYKYQTSNSSKDEDEKSIPLSGGRTFHDMLEQQLSMQVLDDQKMQIARHLIGSLDESGYLRREISAIVDDLAFTQNVSTDEETVLELLRVIQSFDPPGVGCRDLRECLLLQLERKHPDSLAESYVLEHALTIVREYFEEFTKKHYTKIVKKTGLSEEDLKDAIDLILKLNPKPGNSMSESSKVIQHVVPDFVLTIDDGELRLSLNGRNAPELKVSKTYSEMLNTYQQQKGKVDKKQKDALMFVKQKLDSAKWFIDAIKQRQNTLIGTMTAIMEYQKDYFLEGDETKLKPMILKDIAEIVHLDISTISRVVNSKYVQTPYGTFLLKTFFSESLSTDSGEEVSTREVKKILQEAIEGEDKKKPLTDDRLSKLLKDKGYNIARRTVAKYREQLNIPVARLRKEL